MNVSLDGYIVAADGDFDWTGPDPDVFASGSTAFGKSAST
jgi:hypothetical protein